MRISDWSSDVCSSDLVDAVGEALAKLKTRFVHDDPGQSYRRDGPVAVAHFEDNDADAGGNEDVRDLRILRQRRVADLMAKFLSALETGGCCRYGSSHSAGIEPMVCVIKERSRANPSVEPSLGWTYLYRVALARARAQTD